MIVLWAILGMAAALYLLRLSGFLLADVAVPEGWTHALTFVPVATLTALIVSSIAARPDQGAIRFLAAIGAAVVVWRTRRMWLCIVAGMCFYWILRLI
jgi:branched-subunit amino acid transport protein